MNVHISADPRGGAPGVLRESAKVRNHLQGSELQIIKKPWRLGKLAGGRRKAMVEN